MSLLRDAQAVAKATGCDVAAVTAALPAILDALDTEGILHDDVVIGAQATVAVECAFKPVAEAWWLDQATRDHYYNTKQYAQVDPITGQRYYGRGFIQVTWKSNYAKYGQQLGLDLVDHPDLALQLPVAAKILALYFKERHADVACEQQDWERVRRLVNGGTRGLGRFLQCVQALKGID